MRIKQQFKQHDPSDEQCHCTNCVLAAEPQMSQSPKDSPYFKVITSLPRGGVSFKFVLRDRAAKRTA